LNHRFQGPTVSQFFLSTTPVVSPQLIAQRIKGRLQHLLRPTILDAFQRNYSLRSIGSTKRDKVEAYIASQVEHYQLADSRVDERFRQYQISNDDVDLSSPRQTAHAVYWHNLHLVFVTRERDRHFSDETLSVLHKMVCSAARKKGHRLSRAAILPDHVHIALGCDLSESPQEVALSYLNNLAYAAGAPIFQFSYWMGTFGEYDRGAIR